MHDVIVVGGSYAGMSAALQLARARLNVLIIDAGQRRNRTASTAHGFLTHDGRDPAAIAAAGRADLSEYPNVSWISGSATEAQRSGDTFAVVVATGQRFAARRLVLASGVVDKLPDIAGVGERWGQGIFHCPYCHGYELDLGAIGLLATSPSSIHPTLMLTDWGHVTYFTRSLFEPTVEEHTELLRREVSVERAPVIAVSGAEGAITVRLQDDRVLRFAGLFVPPETQLGSPLAEQLGCALEMGPTGPYVQTDTWKQTTVPGVFACGDMATPAGVVAFAVADGARAGFAAHQSLVFGNQSSH